MPFAQSKSVKVFEKIAKSYEQCSTAHHEAGHCIIACLKLCNIESVEIFESDKINNRIDGLTYYEYPNIDVMKDNSLLIETVNSLISINYAGIITEKHLFKLMSGSDKFPFVLKGSSSDDISDITLLIKKYNLATPGKERTKYKNKMMRSVLNDLQKHWDDVILVAHALFKKKKLTGEDIRKLLTTKSKDKNFWKLQFKNILMIYNDEFNETILKAVI